MSAHCWVSRHEAEGFEHWIDWIIASEDRCRVYAEHLYDEDGTLDATGGHDICLLMDGHEGPHEFQSPATIVVEFGEDNEASRA